MVRYAKASPQVEKVDTTTNGSLLDPGRVAPVLEAGIDRINISIDGMNSDDFSRITKARVNFDKVVADIKWIYANKGNCMIVIKTMNEIIGDRRQQFFDTFGDYCDRIFVENFSPCWPQFDGEERTGWKITQGLYGQPIGDTDSCPYILYGYSVNPEGLVSACFIDWGRRLVIGDVRTESMINIWNSKKMNDLRLMHLEGKRRNHPVCGACGQLSNCLPDNIDMHRDTLLEKLREACD
jgi:radical SAM protein with 4Fe4S-binding SPASM domain